jgi:hypothetical protein
MKHSEVEGVFEENKNIIQDQERNLKTILLIKILLPIQHKQVWILIEKFYEIHDKKIIFQLRKI